MNSEDRLEGLVLKVGPLGENDRLLTLLSASHGQMRLAAPGARRPKSSLAAAVPLAVLALQVGGGRGLRRVRQLTVLRSFAALAGRLETLAAAQGLAELSLLLVPEGSPVEGLLETLLLLLARLEQVVKERQEGLGALALAVQGSVQLLALGGYALPLAHCMRSGARLEPPLGDWSWRCSLIPDEGFVLGAVAGAHVVLNASELALLQRLTRPALPLCRDGSLMGPLPVWLRLLDLVELWSRQHLGRSPRAWRLVREAISPRGPAASSSGSAPPSSP
ncbi:DNA repair protein RecO [Cyanobium sp. Morenito 9A2]|uniref:DNA repair protein RecO n=1 Tax=Cyanobium sp. Morenito 9A2 TaxID=2823718 RepID=UPI0020CF9887|nr:DNA repair protein RecO [Cyanobium sp. Morenito 9A2]MCP9849066.1 DNA repair protein RecO [Cyanobium sp. Morenito 9A2]